MAFGIVGKLRRGLGISVFACLAIPSASWAQSCATCAPQSSSGTYCQQTHCPPCYEHCMEGPPHLHFKCGCPHPICDPCNLPHYGYFETCWTPYPYPPDWSHCTKAPPSALVNLNPASPLSGAPLGTNQQRSPNILPPANPIPSGTDSLPTPRRFDGPRPGL